MKKTMLSRALALLLVLALCALPALAAPISLAQSSVYCLSQSDFPQQEAFADGGIFVSSVPSEGVCRIVYGSRTICAGDVLPAAALDALEIRPEADLKMDCALVYRPISADGVGLPQQLSFRLTGSKNTAPLARGSEFETYKNVANTGTLNVSDAEGDALEYTLVRAPKRGSVELYDDGTFLYTPKENKVGRDSFVFTATDAAGNVSDEATVRVHIVKPTDAATYADLRGKDGEYAAMWLKETGAFCGERVAGTLCFGAEKSVSRGEFLAAAMHVFGREPDDAALTSGFADEEQAASWLRPYLTSALRAGVIGGTPSDDGLLFRPTAELTRAEAAVIVAKLLELPQDTAQTVSTIQPDEDAVPVWARSAAAALQTAGMSLDVANTGSITRLEAAQLLYEAAMVE